jgi:signal transduction histidine kinase
MEKGYILVVDDEPNARGALAELLRGEGYRVETAADAFTALSKIEQGKPDILLTDLKMPGMDGLELVRQLRALHGSAVVVVVVTAFGTVDTAVSAMKEGAVDYITKPIRITDLVPVLQRGLQLQRARAESDRARLDLEAANRDLTVFAGRVAHDLRTPLMPIGLLAGGLKSQSIDPKVLRAADRIVANVARAGDMIEGLLSFSRLGRQDQGGATAAAAVVRQSLDDFVGQIADNEVMVETDLEAGVEVACSPSLFHQIVDNLVGNALKHLKGRQQRWVQVRLAARAGFVELEVTDSGPGIPVDSLGRVFDLFYRVPGNPVSGLGLGLATVKRIVDAHGGQISVSSELNEGTSFRVRLPVSR